MHCFVPRQPHSLSPPFTDPLYIPLSLVGCLVVQFSYLDSLSFRLALSLVLRERKCVRERLIEREIRKVCV